MKRIYQHGYALLITLVMLGLMGVILAGLARRSADVALQAREAEERLRRHWAVLSCERSLLRTTPDRQDARTQAWLAGFDPDQTANGAELSPKPSRYAAAYLTLTGLELYLRIEDEQAKINLNRALEHPSLRHDPAGQEIASQDLVGAHSGRVQINRPEMVQTLGLHPIESWQQLLTARAAPDLLFIQRPDDLLDAPSPQAVPSQLTLWGDGRLNLVVADEATIQNALRDQLSPETIQRLLELHHEDPSLPLSGLITGASENPKDRATLTAALTDRSKCFSMWIGTRPPAEIQRSCDWSMLVLEAGPADGQSGRRTVRFDW